MSTTSVKVAVVMPTFNSEKFLVESIRSVLGQSFQEFRLIILDGGSTDATTEICEILKQRDTRIEILSFPDTTPTHRVNRALAETDFEFYLMAHSDDVSVPCRFERQVEFMQAAKDLLISGSSMHYWMHEKLKPQSIDHSAGIHSFPLNHEEILARLPFWWCFSIPSLIVNGNAIRSRRLFLDETFDVASDWWFFWRAAREGRVANLDEPLISYRQHFASHGPTNVNKIAVEARKIRSLIADEIGLTTALTVGQLSVFLDLIVEYDRIMIPYSEGLADLLNALHAFSPVGINPEIWRENIARMGGQTVSFRSHVDAGGSEPLLKLER